MKYLAIGAHADDIEFGCGGTLSHLASHGHIEAVIITDGSKGGEINGDTQSHIERRQQEARAAAKHLGIQHIHFLKEVDGEVENSQQLRRKLVRIIRAVQPHIILSFDPANRAFTNRFLAHRDHRQTATAVFDATSPAAKNKSYFPDLDVPPHKANEMWFFGTHAPDMYIDITEHLQTKVDALMEHKSQISDREGITQRIKEWASEIAKEQEMDYAECFRVLKL